MSVLGESCWHSEVAFGSFASKLSPCCSFFVDFVVDACGWLAFACLWLALCGWLAFACLCFGSCWLLNGKPPAQQRAFDYTNITAATSSDSAILQYLAPYTRCGPNKKLHVAPSPIFFVRLVSTPAITLDTKCAVRRVYYSYS